MRPSTLIPCLAVVTCVSLSACSNSATIGGFALDVPGGWYSESDEPDSLAVGTKHAEWTFVFVAFTAAQIEGDKSLDAVGTEVARELAEGGDDKDDVNLEFGEPKPITQNGLEGVMLDGKMSDAELAIDVKLAVFVRTDGQYLIAFGFRSPDAQGQHDQAMQALLGSLRPSG